MLTGRRTALWLLLLAAACGDDRSTVLVTVNEVPPQASALQATFRLDGVDAMEPARWDAPDGGFAATTTFVVLLPDGATGQLEVTVTAEDGDGCSAALGSSAVALPADAMQVTLAHQPPAAPELHFPYNGFATGSPWAAAADTLRPRIRWTPAAGASQYQVQIDDSCTSITDCAFPSPEVDDTTTATDYRPAADLPVAMGAPVGRRYFLRVRACDCAECGDWSPARFVDVGRQRADGNGDGYADMLVGSSGIDGGQMDAGAAYPYLGSAQGWLMTSVAAVTGGYMNGFLGASLGWLGDVDGDGRADMALGQYGAPDFEPTVTQAGSVLLLLGIVYDTVMPPAFVYSPTPQVQGYFGVRMTGCDLDADGFSDLIVGAPYEEDDGSEADSGHVHIFPGSAGGPGPPLLLDNPMAAQVSAVFGISLDCDGDVDGDGYVDLAVGATGQGGPGAVFVYRGGPDGVGDAPAYVALAPENQPGSGFGTAVALGDLDDDGFADLVVGADFWGADDGGSAFFYPGSRAGVPVLPTRTLPCPDGVALTNFGDELTIARDLDGDRVADLIVGAALWTGSGATGAAFVYPGGDDGPAATPTYALPSPVAEASSQQGYAVASPGDADGDGDSDLLVSQPFVDLTVVNQGRVWLYPGGSPFSTIPAALHWDGAGQIGAWFGSSMAR